MIAKTGNIIALSALLVLAVFLAGRLWERVQNADAWEKAAPTRLLEGIAKIEDGDSLRIKRLRVRLVGIDAPEFKQFCYKGDEPIACGHMATEYLRSLIQDRPVRCQWIEKDKYQRLLGHCFAGGSDLNRAMVTAGWAVDYSSPADGDNSYKKEERQARQEKRGIWQWRFQRPKNWRKQHPRL